jgi:hypothetical protein
MHHRFVTLAALVALAALTACGRTNFGTGCEKAVELTSPWKEMSLPIDGGQARVCESSGEELKLRSYTWSAKADAAAALKASLTGAGWSESRCNGEACYYGKDGFEVSVQPMDFEVKDKKLVTIAFRHRADPKAKKTAGSSDKQAAAPTDDSFGIPECDDYAAKVAACTSFDKSTKAYTMLVDGWKKGIAAGQNDRVAEACTKAAGLFKCPGA